MDQTESDGVLDDVATMIGCTRSNLHVVASDKGLVVGRISFFEDGDFIDCTKMGVGGKAIPPYIDKIENIQSDAAFILLVEKEAAYMRMAVSMVCCCGVVLYYSSACICGDLIDNMHLCTGGSVLSAVSMHRNHSQGST